MKIVCYQWFWLTYSSLEEQFAMPILISWRCFQRLEKDLFWFCDSTLFSIDLYENTSGFAADIYDGWKVLAQEPLKFQSNKIITRNLKTDQGNIHAIVPKLINLNWIDPRVKHRTWWNTKAMFHPIAHKRNPRNFSQGELGDSSLCFGLYYWELTHN